MPIQKMIGAAFFAAIIAVLSQFAISIGAVPHTLQVMAVTLAGVVLGPRYGALSVLVWLLLGAFGLPVFAMGGSGLGSLFGPLCGFFLGFLLEAWICGYCYIPGQAKRKEQLRAFAFGVLSILLVYIVGVLGFTAYFHWMLHKPMTLYQAILVCAAPFAPFDLIKMVIGVTAGSKITQALEKTGLGFRNMVKKA
jgi:biotin transport system substrate-specific component